jgi:hypothetical protein
MSRLQLALRLAAAIAALEGAIHVPFIWPHLFG